MIISLRLFLVLVLLLRLLVVVLVADEVGEIAIEAGFKRSKILF